MRGVLMLAALLALVVAVPSSASSSRAGGPGATQGKKAKPRCAGTRTAAARKRTAAARKRGAAARKRTARRRTVCARFRPALLRGSAQLIALGAPGTFAAPSPFPAAPVTGPAVSPTPVPGEPAPPTLPPIYSNPRAVQVKAFEFAFRLSKSTVLAGDVRVEFNSTGAEDPHNLVLVRSDGSGSAYQFDEQPSGAVTAKTLALTKGRWTLFCSLPNHQGYGMQATLNVDEG